MMQIKFKIAAKTDVGLVRTNNEDNFQASNDLRIVPMRWINNELCQLGEKGALLVVADGMGGMNAGEVASQIAIETVRDEFTPEKITDEVVLSRFSIEKFMNDVIVKADFRIKEISSQRPETKGMGTTIVLGWLYKEHLYVSWCGDSRAYVYNPKIGLHRLTKDHSYVQQLVDAGKLSDEEAFDFPDSNIITRCLSDANQKAQPESISKPYPIAEGDVILLCTDGLCGMIRDTEIESVIESNISDLGSMTDSLIQAALNASGADNVTVCLCQIVSGGAKSNEKYFSFKQSTTKSSQKKSVELNNNLLKKSLIPILCLSFLMLGGVISWLIQPKNGTSNTSSIPDTTEVFCDSVSNSEGNDSNCINGSELEKGEEILEDKEKKSKSIILKRTNLLDRLKPTPSETAKMDNKVSGQDGLTLNTPQKELTQNTDTVQKDSLESKSVENPLEVVEEILPQGISLEEFKKQYGMDYKSLEKLNPQIKDWTKVQAGTKLRVYKIKK